MSAEMITKAWKGFDKNFRCLTQQYAVGDVCELDGDPIICRRGFHACTTPIDVLAYYPAATSRYAEVELIGQTVAEENSDSKRAASKIRIVREISYFELWQAQRAWAAKQKLEAAATGDSGHAAATGYSGHAAATGYRGHAAATGYCGHAAATGDSGHAAATGDRGHAAATGYRGHAAATGYSGHAAATGYRGHAAATGDRGHAAATGDSGHAAATGYSGHAAATGYRGHAAATGDRGHAAATGDSGHAAATGKNAIAASLGINGTAQATIGNWIVLAAYNDDGDLLQVRTAKCGDGEGELKPGQYRLDETGAFVLCDKEVE
jgi:hypothetical protein